MTIKKQFTYAAVLIGLSSLLSIGSLALPSLAKTTALSQTKSEQTNGPLRQGLPGRRLGGGTRGEQVFAADYSYLAALTTSDNLSITAAERPTLMFYIPEMVTEQTGELVLRDAQDNSVYETTFNIASEGGIVTVNTAEEPTMPALTPNETYRWYFSIVSDTTERAKDIAVHGNIRRVETEAWLAELSIDSAEIARLEREDPLMQARVLYQQANLWHDAALILAELRQANPTDEAIAAEWEQLIEAAGLAAIIEMPEPAVQIGLN